MLDAGGQLIDGSAEEYISKWLERDDSFYALLWGDFGDGKSFFTYVLARYVAEQFLRSPNAGWIPLRFSLGTLSGNNKDERQFLEDRLEEFFADLASWKQIKIDTKYKFFIILDGLDEMSLDMSENAVLRNLVRLENLLPQFNGCKILVTSRKMDSHTDSISLDTFKLKIGRDNLAQALWDSVGQFSERTAEDADHGVASRTLLKRGSTDPKKRCFFHRSMKEFFVACGIVRALCQANEGKDENKNRDEARAVLSRCRLGHEILEFAGQKLRHLEGQQRTLIRDLLAEFAHEIRIEYSIHPVFLPENSVSLLHYGGFGLPGTDWSGLCLDEVILSV